MFGAFEIASETMSKPPSFPVSLASVLGTVEPSIAVDVTVQLFCFLHITIFQLLFVPAGAPSVPICKLSELLRARSALVKDAPSCHRCTLFSSLSVICR